MKYTFPIIGILLFAVNAAFATPQTVRMGGVISYVDAGLADHFVLGTSYELGFSYDPAGASVASVYLDTNGYHFSGSGIVMIQNDVPYDEFIVAYAPVSGFNLAPFDPPVVYVDFIDYSSSIFSSNTLPASFPMLSEWGQVIANLGYEDISENISRRVNFTVDTVTVIPEPSSIALWFGISAVSLAVLKRRRNAA